MPNDDTVLNNSAVPELAVDFIRKVFDDYETTDYNPLPGFLRRQERRAELVLTPFSDEGRDLAAASSELIDALEHDANVRHPRFFGFIPGPAQSVSWLGDVIATAYNSHAGGWAQGPGASATEKQVIAWANAALGLDRNPHAGGIIESGGSLAGMMALAAARDAHVPAGQFDKAVAYLTSQTHSSLRKALHIIGVDSSHLRVVATSDGHRMDVEDLRAHITADRETGLVPFVVIGTCGTTNTGAIDPLDAIADVCEAEGLWFHCDGAYGASVVLSDRQELARGIERADSVTWDGHKWLYQSYGCALLLVKDVRTLLRTYTAGGEYLQEVEGTAKDPDWWDLGPELTRPARGPRFWLTLQAVGTRALGEMVSTSIRRAEHFEARVRERGRLEVVTPASLAIVTFTVAGEDAADVERRNLALAGYLRRHNIAGIFTTKLDGRNVLRLCTISPEESEDDLDELIDEIDAALDTLGL